MTKQKVRQLIEEIIDSFTPDWKASNYKRWLNPDICRGLKKFLHKYQEASLIILCLIRGKYVEIDGWDPVDVWVCITTLADYMWERFFYDADFVNNVFASYFYFSYYFKYSHEEFVSILKYQDFFNPFKDLVYCDYKHQCELTDAILVKRWEWFSTHHTKAAQCWKGLNEKRRLYLMARALIWGPYELKWFKDYPPDFLPASSNPDYEMVIEALRTLLRNDRQWREEDEERVAQSEERKDIEGECRWKVSQIKVVYPETFKPRVLSETERVTVKAACVEELRNAGETIRNVATTIDEFASFCTLLAKPENHIQILSGQFVEKQVYIRTASDMKEDMVQELTRLNRFEAWTKTLKPDNKVLKGKIKTVSVSDYHEYNEDYLTGLKTILERSRSEHCVQRMLIEEEIIKRQAKWRASKSSPPAPKKTDKGITDRQTNPPPISSSI